MNLFDLLTSITSKNIVELFFGGSAEGTDNLTIEGEKVSSLTFEIF